MDVSLGTELKFNCTFDEPLEPSLFGAPNEFQIKGDPLNRTFVIEKTETVEDGLTVHFTLKR